MKKEFISYFSKNGIRFHHSLSTYEEHEQDSQRVESHDMCELFLLLNGHVTYFIEGKIYDVTPLDVILISPHEVHSLQMDTTQNYERIVLHFSPALLPILRDFNPLQPFEKAKYTNHKIPARFIEKSNLRALFDEIKTLCPNKTEYTDFKIITIIHRILETLNIVSSLHVAEGDYVPSSVFTVNSLSRQCVDYINTHINEHFNASTIAQHLNVSTSYMQHTFKKEMGIPLQQYVHVQKMQLAQKLLLDGLPPQEVSDILGYNYYATFYKNYLKYYSRKPSKIPFFHQRRIVDGKELDPSPPKKLPENT